jgi:hypothetical protein
VGKLGLHWADRRTDCEAKAWKTGALTAAKAQIEALKSDRAHEARKLEIEAFEAQTNRMRAMKG